MKIIKRDGSSMEVTKKKVKKETKKQAIERLKKTLIYVQKELKELEE